MASFYDLDYIIDINERRIEQYAGAYQKVLSVIPYLICFGAFVAKKEESVQKIEVVNNDKNSNLQTNSNMANSTNNTKETKGISDLPGVDSSKVIPSSPIYIKENSYTPTVKDNKKKK